MQYADCIKRIQTYLKSGDGYVRFIHVHQLDTMRQLRTYLAGQNYRVLTPAMYANHDEDPILENLYRDLRSFQGNILLDGFTTQLKLLGRADIQRFLSVLSNSSFSRAHILVLCYQCAKEFAEFDMRAQRRIYDIDEPDEAQSKLYMISETTAQTTNIKSADGIENVGIMLETEPVCIYVSTKKTAASYPHSILPIIEWQDSYAALCAADPMTLQIQRDWGGDEEWLWAKTHVTKAGSWSNVFAKLPGFPNSLDITLSKWKDNAPEENWLCFIALKLGYSRNWVLSTAAKHSTNSDEFPRKLFFSILSDDYRNPEFAAHYAQWKSMLDTMQLNDEPLVMDYIGAAMRYKQNALYYLTDRTKLEKEKILELLDAYCDQFERDTLVSIVKMIYPELAKYLGTFDFEPNGWLSTYFTEYRFSKVLNHISPLLKQMADEQAVNRDYNRLPARSSVLTVTPIDGSFLYYVDSMGAEFLPYLRAKCMDYDLRMKVTICHCELPSITCFNNAFMHDFPDKACTKVSEMDDIKHKGKEDYDYQKSRLPLHLIRELEILDEILRKGRNKLLAGDYRRILIVSDHGATRMAVINNDIIDIDVNSKGTHCGRICAYTDEVAKAQIPNATREGDYYVLANYDRFKGCRPASVEAHGGATPEEVIVPIIEITIKRHDINVTISSEVEYTFREGAQLNLFASAKLTNVTIRVNGNLYEAQPSADQQNFLFIMPDIKRKGTYTADVYEQGDEIASGLEFTARSKAGSTNSKPGSIL